MSLAEFLLKEIKGLTHEAERGRDSMPNDDKSRVRGYFEGRLYAYNQIKIFVDAYRTKGKRKEKD